MPTHTFVHLLYDLLLRVAMPVAELRKSSQSPVKILSFACAWEGTDDFCTLFTCRGLGTLLHIFCPGGRMHIAVSHISFRKGFRLCC